MKFQREMEGLHEVPFEGTRSARRFYEHVSKEAWKMWVEHMKMLMNEYRLNLGTQQAQEFLISSKWTTTSSAKAPRSRPITFLHSKG